MLFRSPDLGADRRDAGRNLTMTEPNEVNGQASHQAPGQQQMTQMVIAWVTPAMTAVTRGLMLSIQGAPPRFVLGMACRVLGNIVGCAFNGTLADVLSARRECREAFLKGLEEAPPPPPPPPQPGQPMTRLS